MQFHNWLDELIRRLEYPKALVEDIHLKADEEHPEYISDRANEAVMELEVIIDYLKAVSDHLKNLKEKGEEQGGA